MAAALEERFPGLEMEAIAHDLQNNQAAMRFVRENSDAVVLLDGINQQQLLAGLGMTTVGYDAIVPFIAFGDSGREHSAPRLLDGTITLEQLRQIYLNELTQVNNRRIQPFLPFVEQFDETGVLQGDATAHPTIQQIKELLFPNNLSRQDELQDQFQDIADQAEQNWQSEVDNGGGKAHNIYARIFREFENQVGEAEENLVVGIGVDRLSTVFGQCTAYPLAVQFEGSTFQVFQQIGDQPIDMETNLCSDKGSYWIDNSLFPIGDDNPDGGAEYYPLAYPMSVVYHQGAEAGKAFAELLKTAQGQYLLNEVGLVTQCSAPEIRNAVWGGK
ncbi:MAG: hypothetical protein ACFB8W_21815 [Elainellaceae cyanobacterium]